MVPPLDMLCLLGFGLGPAPWCLGFAREARQAPRRAAALLVLLVSWCLLQMATALVLGMFGALSLRGLIIAEGVLFVTGLLVMRGDDRSQLPDLRPAPLTWMEWGLMLGIALATTSLLLHLAATPITEYDSLAYHLPTMASWYQAHAFVMLDQFYEGRLQISRYPYGWEALSALLLFPFGDDFLVALTNLLAWLLFGVGTYVVAARLGARPLFALAFAFLLLTTPIACEHVAMMRVDLPLGAFFMAGLALALGTPRSPPTAALFIATLGMLAGIKTSGLIYAACLVPAFAWAWLADPRLPAGMVGWRGAVLTGVALAGGAVVGLFWYTRNLVETGNPLGFVRVVIAGVTLLSGPLDSGRIAATTLWTRFDVGRLSHWGILLEQTWKRLGAPFVLGLLGAHGVRLFRHPHGRITRRDHLVLLVGLLIATAVAYWTTPTSATNWSGPLTSWMGQAIRYAFPLIGLLAVSGALALSGTRLPDEIVVSTVIAAGLARTSSRLLPVAAGLLALVWVAYQLARAPGVSRVLATCVLASVIVAASYVLHTARAAGREAAYRGLLGFIDGEVPVHETVGYLLSHQSYLFYGSHFDRRVVYVPARTDDRAAWIAGLRAARIGFVALGPLGPEWRQRNEVGWLRERDGTFTLVFGEDETAAPVVYQLNRR